MEPYSYQALSDSEYIGVVRVQQKGISIKECLKELKFPPGDDNSRKILVDLTAIGKPYVSFHVSHDGVALWNSNERVIPSEGLLQATLAVEDNER